MDDLIAEFNSTIEQWKKISLDDPHKGLALADDAVKCAQRIGNLFLTRALAVRGSALRSIGAHNESEKVLLGILASLDARDVAERTDILRRIAYLRAEQRRFDAAMEIIEEAEAASKSLPNHQQGKILLAKGYIYGEAARYHEAIPIFVRALLLLDARECPVSYDVAIHNIIVAISLDEKLDLPTLRSLLRSFDRARHGLSKKSRIFRLKLKWAGAIVDLRLGINNKALSALLSLRREFRLNRRPSVELAMISIDVGQAYIEAEDWERACIMLEKAHSLLEEVEGISPTAASSLAAAIEGLRTNHFNIELLLAARRAFLISNAVKKGARSMQYLSD